MSDGTLVRFARACEFLLGALFFGAAALKLANLALFAGQIKSYGVIESSELIKAVSVTVVPLEAALGVAMLAGLRLGGAVYWLALGMLLFFSGLVAYAWPEECGCFGPIKMGPWETLGKNVVMGGMALTALFALRRRNASDPDFGVVGKWVVTLVMGGLVLYFTQDQLYNSEKKAPVTPPVINTVIETPPVVTSPQVIPPTTEAPTATPISTPTPQPTAAAEGEATEPTEVIDFPPDAEAMFAEYTVIGQDGAPLALASGQYLVALLNATCDHCKETVPAVNLLALRPDVPTVVALVQEPAPGDMDNFMLETSAAFPALSMGNDMRFLDFVKVAPPQFTLIKDGRPVKSWTNHPPTAEDLQAAAGLTP